MDRPQLESCISVGTAYSTQPASTALVSLESEIPEVLYKGMKEFIGSNPNWDQYSLIRSALASFLFQNGCRDRAVTETYLSELFTRSDA